MTDLPHLSEIEAEILRLLIGNKSMYGLELVAASPVLKRGTIYVTLGRMADKNYVTSKAEKREGEPGLPRRVFSVTGLGARVFRARRAAELVLQEGIP